MKNTATKIMVGSCITWALVCAGLFSQKIINQNIEDKTAVADVRIIDNQEIMPCPCLREYLAFDKSGDGKIDEIKEYRSSIIAGRGMIPAFHIERYSQKDKKFKELNKKYFNQNP